MTNERIEQAKLKYVENNLKLYNQNKELVLMYNEYIEHIVELFDYIKNNDSDLFYTIVFAILLEIGFFSADRKITLNEEMSEELIFKTGINIICGKGLCRNVAFFYEDVFKYFYNYPLKVCCFDKHGEVTEETKTYGNHVINLTDYHDTLYGFDLTNRCIFKIKDYHKFEGLGFDYSLEHKPNGDLLFDLTASLEKKSNFLNEEAQRKKLFKIAASRNILSLEEYNNLIKYANEFIIERKNTFQSFLIQNEELTHEIKKKMLSLR